ncbi:cleavage and polyadenylation specificity factor subunit 1-like, partial [Rhincodon typus]|uniref:cleavage and polyadenylation specificity factor subunit 1-like n=1 Tax=Rhincodon typus TaxID=259920 RepID=UPI00202FD1AD
LFQQRSIRAQVVTTFELPGCHDMWTVVASRDEVNTKDQTGDGEKIEKESKEVAPEEDVKKHGFLILSREDSTMILQTGQEIMELDASGFATQGPTIFAGNIGDNKYIVQVSPLGIRLLEGVNQLHFIPVDLGSPIMHCAVCDPYVVIMSGEGQVTMFVLKRDTYGGNTHRLTMQKPQIHMLSKVIALCAYRDISGMFTTESRASVVKEDTMKGSQSEMETMITNMSTTVDDEEEMLYGESGSALFSPPKEEPSRSSVPMAEKEPSHLKVEPTNWCMLVRENGVMEIYQLPDWRLVFLVKNFPVGQRVLVDSSSGQHMTQGEIKKEEFARLTEMPAVREVLLVGLGNRQTRPFLLYATISGLFPYPRQMQYLIILYVTSSKSGE